MIIVAVCDVDLVVALLSSCRVSHDMCVHEGLNDFDNCIGR